MSWAIGIDFGTSRSAGAIGQLDRQRARSASGGVDFAATLVSPLEIEGNRWVASMVLRTPEGELVLGTAADNLAGVHPDRLDLTPKRSLGTGAPILLGGEPIDPRDAAAAVLRMIVAEGRLRSGGTEPDHCVLTHPVRWADLRRQALREAGERAGLREITLVEEPVAAAIHYASEHVDVGAHVGVYDLGGGTFDTAVLRRTDDGFEVVGVPGGDEHIGGENFDHRLFRYFGECLAETSPELWQQMLESDDRKWKRAALDLLVQARRAKEALSSYTSTQVFVPIADRDVLINRSQFEAMIIDDIERTVDLMEDTVLDSGLAIDDLSAVFLVGGSSRVPLVAQLVTERFGTRVVTRDEPKAVVALGAARLAALRLASSAPQASPEAAAPTAPGDWLATMAPPRVDERRDGVPSASKSTLTPEQLAALAPPPMASPLLAAPPTPALAAAPPLATERVQLPADVAPPPGGPFAAPAPPQPVTVAWRMAVGETPGQLRADGDLVALGSRDGIVRGIDPRSGVLRWQTAIGASVWAAPAVDDDLVVFGSLDGRIVAVGRSDGQQRWSIDTRSSIAAAPAVSGPMVVAANDAGHVLGLDRATGSLRWDLPVAAAVRADVVVAGRVAIVGTTAGTVFAVDVATGRAMWGYRTGGAVMAAPAFVADRVVVPGGDGVVYGLRSTDGAGVYGVRCAGPVNTPVATTDVAFAVVDEAGVLRVHRIDTGQQIAELSVGGHQATGVALFPQQGLPTTAVVETGTGDVVAHDLATRAVRFRVPTGGGNRSVPVAASGLAVIGTGFGQLYGLVV